MKTQQSARARTAPETGKQRKQAGTGQAAGGVAQLASLREASVDPLLLDTLDALKVDALTIAIRTSGDERLVACTRDGQIREANGSISLGLVARGPTRLSGGAGLLQAVECQSLFGFTPVTYYGAPFARTTHGATGGIAAWSRRSRRWSVEEGTMLRRLAAYCERTLDNG